MPTDAPTLPQSADTLYRDAAACFLDHYGRPHKVAAYAPGRVEVLGNHTDYNEGFVLSAAIHIGNCFLIARAEGNTARVYSANLDDSDAFDVTAPVAATEQLWSNYIKGMVAGLGNGGNIDQGFDAVVMGNLPLGSGLSSSASLEMAAGLAIAKLYGLQVQPLELARIGQQAEHDFVGAKVGLLDQMTSLHGKADHLVMSDFRALTVDHVSLGEDTSFLLCNTRVAHANTDGQYNARRESCETAAAHFNTVLDHEVTALRDVSWEEWTAHHAGLDAVVGQHAAHPIGENGRVLRGRELLRQEDLKSFGELMYASHASSMKFFDNSCPELDFVVEASRHIPGILGARLSGGGFGGSALLLVHPRDEATIAHAMERAFEAEFGRPCEVLATAASNGARVIGN